MSESAGTALEVILLRLTLFIRSQLPQNAMFAEALSSGLSHESVSTGHNYLHHTLLFSSNASTGGALRSFSEIDVTGSGQVMPI